MRDLEITHISSPSDYEIVSPEVPSASGSFPQTSAPDYEFVSPDGQREVVASIPVTAEAAKITKRKLRQLKRYRILMNRKAIRAVERVKRKQKSRTKAKMERASRRRNRR